MNKLGEFIVNAAFHRWIARTLLVVLVAELVPLPTLAVERNSGPALCDNKPDAKADEETVKRWTNDVTSNSQRHHAIGKTQERSAFLLEAGNAVKRVCEEKRKSEPRYQALRADFQKGAPTGGDACVGFQAQEKNLISASAAREPYFKQLKDYREGVNDSASGKHPGLRPLYSRGTQAAYKIVQERTDDLKQELERERQWAWGKPLAKGAGIGDGYFSAILKELEAEQAQAQKMKAELGQMMDTLHKKNPNCTPSEDAKRVVAEGKASSGPNGAPDKDDSMLSGADRNRKNGKGQPGADGVDGAGTGETDGEGGGKKNTNGASQSGGNGGKDDDLLSGNGALIAGGVLAAGAAGAAAYLLTDKKNREALVGFWDDLVGNDKKGGAAGEGDPPLPRPEQVAISDKFAFSTGLALMKAQQGASEARWVMSPAEADARYKKLQEMGIGYRQYNYFWSGTESSPQLSSATPVACPEGHHLVPKDEAERTSLGYHKFHCYNTAQIANFDDALKRDAAAGFQSGVVIWSSPVGYRHPECAGMHWAGGIMKDGCVPRDDAMDDFEDFVNFQASRYNGGAFGKISHFIVWNENGSEEWFDYSPTVPKGATSGAGVEKRIDKYADMVKRAHAALARHQKKALLYVSTDQLWEPGQAAGHMGTRVLLDGLWARLGVDYSWSVAVHPYGNVYDGVKPNIYTFNNLDMVFNYQKAKLAERGVAEPMTHPHAYMSATEQGWGVDAGLNRDNQARNLCLAQDRVSRMPWLIMTTHNYFHSHEPDEGTGTSSQGLYFGLIPYTIPNDLTGLENTPTGQAFFATGKDQWAKNNTNFCCTKWKVGCANKPK